jgi:hypothetical protein
MASSVNGSLQPFIPIRSTAVSDRSKILTDDFLFITDDLVSIIARNIRQFLAKQNSEKPE